MGHTSRRSCLLSVRPFSRVKRLKQQNRTAVRKKIRDDGARKPPDRAAGRHAARSAYGRPTSGSVRKAAAAEQVSPSLHVSEPSRPWPCRCGLESARVAPGVATWVEPQASVVLPATSHCSEDDSRPRFGLSAPPTLPFICKGVGESKTEHLCRDVAETRRADALPAAAATRVSTEGGPRDRPRRQSAASGPGSPASGATGTTRPEGCRRPDPHLAVDRLGDDLWPWTPLPSGSVRCDSGFCTTRRDSPEMPIGPSETLTGRRSAACRPAVYCLA